MIPGPRPEQLAEIAASAADLHRRLFQVEPLVAMLSFSTEGSADHPIVDRVRAAIGEVNRLRPDLRWRGRCSSTAPSAPLSPPGRCHGPSSQVGRTVSCFPTLKEGNIVYKAAERLGGCRALGSFVLNLRHPWVDLSRRCSVDDIVDTATLPAGGSLPDQTAGSDLPAAGRRTHAHSGAVSATQERGIA